MRKRILLDVTGEVLARMVSNLSASASWAGSMSVSGAVSVRSSRGRRWAVGLGSQFRFEVRTKYVRSGTGNPVNETRVGYSRFPSGAARSRPEGARPRGCSDVHLTGRCTHVLCIGYWPSGDGRGARPPGTPGRPTGGRSAGVAHRLVAVVEVGVAQGVAAARGTRSRPRRSARCGPRPARCPRPVGGEEAGDLGQHVVEVAGLAAGVGRERVAVHRDRRPTPPGARRRAPPPAAAAASVPRWPPPSG